MSETLDKVSDFFGMLSGIVWGPFFLIPLLLGTGIVLSIRLGFLQFHKLWPALKLGILRRRDEGAFAGDVSQFQALTTALAATVGVGNIVGVAGAIAVGGPGALFWMWVTGLLGMASKYAEAFLGVRFRTKDAAGEISGGPQYYLERGIKGPLGKVLAISFAVLAALASFGIGNMTQGNAITENIHNTFGIEPWIIGIVLTVVAFAVLVGGIKSIGRVTAALVPFMIVVYILGATFILIVNAGQVPAAFGQIFSEAFTGHAAFGGAAGSAFLLALKMGVARGIFSNESGMGSAAIAAAAAKTTHPVRQGLVSMTQTFIDTIIVVTFTGLVLITTGVWEKADISQATLTAEAFTHGLPGNWGHIIVTCSIALFAFSTVLGWAYYGERCTERLVGRGGVMPYRVLFSLVVFVGATVPLKVVWNFADLMNGLMALPNLIGLLILSGLIARETKHYLANDPPLTASKDEIDAFMEGHVGGIDTYETTGK
ncbi:sodium:alanine symporter family protein [Bowdeniella nasicola]|uniref:Sodium:alanine symporter family protein n=1 Tax=Bowdeniella nasicola TaxID=208480 RepID=A0A1Q5Q2Y6_9ACTO|nr:sodium:alanine symporter family protein [Bowdeniella nasicola]OKL54176.1 sodium:alanine symporter family protein [Bowdeniella nasicola]